MQVFVPIRNVGYRSVCWVLLALLLSARLGAQEELRISHILLRSKDEAAKVRAEILEKGGDANAFKVACRVHSKDPTTKPLGGDLGWNRRTSGLDPKFVEAAFALQTGAVSEPVLTSFGWHLIQVTGRRDASSGQQADSSGSAGDDGTEGDDTVTADDPGDSGDGGTDDDSIAGNGDEVSSAGSEVAPVAPAPVLDAKRRPLRGPRQLFLTIETALSSGDSRVPAQRTHRPNAAVELNLTLKNEGTDAQKVPVPELLALGFQATRLSDGKVISGDFSSLGEPASFFTNLDTYGIVGRVVSLNDYFPALTASGRFQLDWSASTLFANLESRFTKVTDLEDYATIKSGLSSSTAIRVDRVLRDKARHWDTKLRSRPFGFAIFDDVQAGKKYYARIRFRGGASEVVFELSAQRSGGNLTAVQTFIALANEGFYDELNFYDIQAGNYALGGCPTLDGLGAPSIPVIAKNDEKVGHVRGTVSFVSRNSPRSGPVGGSQIGSIFFVSLKDHSEWNDVHVPIGTVVQGIEVFDSLKPYQSTIESVVILTEDEYSGKVDARDSVTTGNPEAVLSTSKGDVGVTLYEDVAFNTVASFITLAEDGFFDKGPDDGKMTFYEVLADDSGKIVAITGSPTNDAEGNPGYSLRDEVNDRKVERGSLVMVKAYDAESDAYVADSAGSQFFIALRDIPAYDFQKSFTVFGKVTSGLDVLDQIEKGDTLEKVEITKKRNRPYDRFRKGD